MARKCQKLSGSSNANETLADKTLNLRLVTSKPFRSHGSKIRSVQICHTFERTRQDAGLCITLVDLFVKCPAIIFEESAMYSSSAVGTNPIEQVGEHSRSITAIEGSSRQIQNGTARRPSLPRKTIAVLLRQRASSIRSVSFA